MAEDLNTLSERKLKDIKNNDIFIAMLHIIVQRSTCP